MSDKLALITKALQEHHDIRNNVKLAGDSVNDIGALITLQQAQSGWTQSSGEALMAKQNQMQQAINFLADGLKTHFAFEEKAFPPLFGKLLMKALIFEHQEIGRQIDNAGTMLASIKLEGLRQSELLSKKLLIQQSISTLGQRIEEHASHEEIILRMIKHALEAEVGQET